MKGSFLKITYGFLDQNHYVDNFFKVVGMMNVKSLIFFWTVENFVSHIPNHYFWIQGGYNCMGYYFFYFSSENYVTTIG